MTLKLLTGDVWQAEPWPRGPVRPPPCPIRCCRPQDIDRQTLPVPVHEIQQQWPQLLCIRYSLVILEIAVGATHPPHVDRGGHLCSGGGKQRSLCGKAADSIPTAASGMCNRTLTGVARGTSGTQASTAPGQVALIAIVVGVHQYYGVHRYVSLLLVQFQS